MKIQKIRESDYLESTQEITFAILLGSVASILTSREGGKIDGKIIHGDPAITTIYGAPGMGKTFAAKKIGTPTATPFGDISPLALAIGKPVFFTSFHAQNTTQEELGMNIPTNQEHPDLAGIAKMIRAKGTAHLTREMQEKLLAEGKSPFQLIHIDEPGRNKAILSQITSTFVDCNCGKVSPHPAYTMIVFTDNGVSTEGTVEFSTHLVNRCIQFAINSNAEAYQRDIVNLKKEKMKDSDRSVCRWLMTAMTNPLHDLNYAFKSIRSDRYAVAIDHATSYLKGLELDLNGKKATPFQGLPYLEKIRKAAIAGCMGNEAAIQDDMYDLVQDNGLKPFEDFVSSPVGTIPDSILPSYAYTICGIAEIYPKNPKTKVVKDWLDKEIKPAKADLYREIKRRYPSLV